MSLQPVAILGLDGWVSTPKEKMDNLWMHFVEANKSQSVTARNKTFSFQYYFVAAGQSRAQLKDDMQAALKEYFSGYYSSVDVAVNVVDSESRPGTQVIEIYLEAKDEYGKKYNLAKVSSDISSKTIRWANLNNYGDENRFNQ